MADITKEDVIEWLSNQTVLDIAGLVKDLEDKWGVSAAAPVSYTHLTLPTTPYV